MKATRRPKKKAKAARRPGKPKPRGPDDRREHLDCTWQTPWSILSRAEVFFGGPIPFDPATALDNPTRALRYCALAPGFDTPLLEFDERSAQRALFAAPPVVGELVSHDGLSVAWDWPTWCNPPYGEFLRTWLGHFCLEARRGTTIVALVPANRFDQACFQKALALTNAVCLIRGRVDFISTVDYQPVKQNPWGSMLMGFNVDASRWLEAFSSLGSCYALTAMVQPIEEQLAPFPPPVLAGPGPFTLALWVKPEPSPEQREAARREEEALRAIRAIQGAPLEGCGSDDCDDCYPK